MARKPKTTEEPRIGPRIGRKDLQDPDRDARKDSGEGDAERSDREAGAGRPVQLDEEGRSQPAGSDSPRPTDDAVVPK